MGWWELRNRMRLIHRGSKRQRWFCEELRRFRKDEWKKAPLWRISFRYVARL